MNRALLLALFLGFAVPGWATTYYVNKAGLDSNSCATAQSSTPANAKLTLSGVAGGISCLASGDTLIVGNGTYVEAINNTVPSGSMGAPTTIQALNRNQAIMRPTATASSNFVVDVEAKNWIVFDGIYMDCVNSTSTECEAFYVGNSGTSTHIDIKNGTVTNAKGTFGQGIEYRTVNNSTISNMDVVNNGNATTDQGIYLSDATTTAITVDGCRFNGNYAYGFQINHGGHDNIIKNNVAWGQLNRAGFLDNDGSNNLFYNNISYGNLTGNGDGIRIGGTSDQLLNNTIFGNGSYCIRDAGAGTVIKNNICYQNTDGAILETGSGTCSNNLNVTSCGSTEGSTNPLFVSSGTGDFHIPPTSPAATGTFLNLSSTFTTDADGTTRTVPWSAGAYVASSPDNLVFSSQPTNVISGNNFSPDITVTANLSGGGTDTGFTGNVTLAINGCGASVTGTTTRAAVSGVATFITLGATTFTSGCAFTASATGTNSVVSNTFNVICAATKLAFTFQPSNAQIGASLGKVAVAIENAGGMICTDNTSVVTIANKGGSCIGMVLGGNAINNAVAGVFTTNNLSESGAGSCILHATDGALTAADSNLFNVSSHVPGPSGRIRTH